ncbi:MAG: hypothetical protein ACRBDI_09510 [Alphaproteobacteria bacterium]
MLNIENARPKTQQILQHLETFEGYCLGKEDYIPARYREINEELSITTVLFLGKRKYYKDTKGKRIIWKGLDDKDYDLGYTHNAKVMRDYPGFHRKTIKALGENQIKECKIIPISDQNKSIAMVTLHDDTVGLGHDYRIALRNAILKQHLKKQFNMASLSDIWNKIWAHA